MSAIVQMFSFLTYLRAIEISFFLCIVAIVVLIIGLLCVKDKNTVLIATSMLFVVAIAIIADQLFVYVVSLFILGPVLVNEDYFINLIKEWRTNTTKTVVTDEKIYGKPLNVVNNKKV